MAGHWVAGTGKHWHCLAATGTRHWKIPGALAGSSRDPYWASIPDSRHHWVALGTTMHQAAGTSGQGAPAGGSVWF